MPHYLPEPKEKTIPKIGILLGNLGAPTAPTSSAVRAYLKEFLSDPRIVSIPKPIWWIILHIFILNIRPRQSAERYAKIWGQEGSPLLAYTKKLVLLLKEQFEQTGFVDRFVIMPAMRYGEPNITEAVNFLKQKNCTRILFLPMYPQYVSSGMGSSLESFFKALIPYRYVPSIRTVEPYHHHPAYIEALTQHISSFWKENGEPEQLIMSFHGLPKRNVNQGDPYYNHCQETANLLSQSLSLDKHHYQFTFQSRFKAGEWLKPYTNQVLQTLGKQGVRCVDVVCPGFLVDCLETLEEIAIESKTFFLKAGGQKFRYIPCLNEKALDLLMILALENLQSWLPRIEGDEQNHHNVNN